MLPVSHRRCKSETMFPLRGFVVHTVKHVATSMLCAGVALWGNYKYKYKVAAGKNLRGTLATDCWCRCFTKG